MTAPVTSASRWNRRTKADLVERLDVAERCLWASLVDAIGHHDRYALGNGPFDRLADSYWADAQVLVGALFFLTNEDQSAIWDRALREVRTVRADQQVRS
jgi:hypothetical protein